MTSGAPRPPMLPMLIGALLRPEDRELAALLVSRLQERGHRLELATSGEELLTGGPWDLIVADAQLPGQWSGLGLIEALRASGAEAATLLVGEEPSFPLVRQALRLGVGDFLLRPLGVEGLLEAIVRAETVRDGRSSLVRSLPATRESVASGARSAAAYLVEHAVRPSHRIRVASAIAEVLHLVCDRTAPEGPEGAAHDEARVTLRLQLDGTRVAAEIEAHGRDLAALTGVPPALPGFPVFEDELSRARKLCEELDVHPTLLGSRVRLAFELFPARFAEERDELAEAEFLLPEAARRLVSELKRKDRMALPPALTTTLGRLLSGPSGTGGTGSTGRSFSSASER